MINKKTIIAIIPARGGSKRFPGKNIHLLGGKPLIGWTLEAALQSSFIDTVVVSTNDQPVAEIAKQYGAEVPFIRPDLLALDETPTFDVVRHAIEYYQENLHKVFDFVILLQPTSPLRSSAHIDQSILYLMGKQADAVVSVCPVEHPLEWMNALPDNFSMEGFIKNEYKGLRSQDLGVAYRLNGAIYLCKTSRLIQDKTFLLEDSIFGFVMNQEDSVDIDTEFDLKLCQFLLSNRLNRNV